MWIMLTNKEAISIVLDLFHRKLYQVTRVRNIDLHVAGSQIIGKPDEKIGNNSKSHIIMNNNGIR